MVGLAVFALVVAAVLIRRFFPTGSDGFWVCDKNNRWIRQGNPAYPKPTVPCKKPSLPTKKDDCLKTGGIWKKQRSAPFETCNRKAVDRGNLCRDSSECEGTCQVDLSKEELKKGMSGKLNFNKKYGQCSVWVVELGCFGIMEKGKAKIICID